MWIDPPEIGRYLGQCAHYCGTEHAKMLLTVDVQSRGDFETWVQAQKAPAAVFDLVAAGWRVFET
jgi:cytochrome c oxidase subunit II